MRMQAYVFCFIYMYATCMGRGLNRTLACSSNEIRYTKSQILSLCPEIEHHRTSCIFSIFPAEHPVNFGCPSGRLGKLPPSVPARRATGLVVDPPNQNISTTPPRFHHVDAETASSLWVKFGCWKHLIIFSEAPTWTDYLDDLFWEKNMVLGSSCLQATIG